MDKRRVRTFASRTIAFMTGAIAYACFSVIALFVNTFPSGMEQIFEVIGAAILGACAGISANYAMRHLWVEDE